MKVSQFFGKFLSKYLWGNLLAMMLLLAAVCFAVKYGIDVYTHHGEKITVPNVVHKSYADAAHILESLGLEVEISDTGYVKTLPPDCILEQSVKAGSIVKSGRIIYLVINASSTPTIAIPDVIDNSSYREARAKLIAMGFKVSEPQMVPGEKDWVYGIKVRGKNVINGQRVSVEDILTLQVGDGMIDAADSVAFADPVYEEEEDVFEEIVEEPAAEESESKSTADPAQPTTPAKPATPATPATPEKDEFEVVTGP
jgi:beta-lactam-binding protein with PASTA domain